MLSLLLSEAGQVCEEGAVGWGHGASGEEASWGLRDAEHIGARVELKKHRCVCFSEKCVIVSPDKEDKEEVMEGSSGVPRFSMLLLVGLLHTNPSWWSVESSRWRGLGDLGLSRWVVSFPFPYNATVLLHVYENTSTLKK